MDIAETGFTLEKGKRLPLMKRYLVDWRGKAAQKDILAEWLRRETRNLMGFPAQVQILQMSNLFIIFNFYTFT